MFLLMDLETGGLDPKESSILTAYLAVCDNKMNIIEDLDLKIMPNDGLPKYTEEALKVNNIDIDEHVKSAITESEAASKILDLLDRHFDGKKKIMPFGQNVGFDINFLQKTIISEKDWNKRCTKYTLDLIVLGTLLKQLGIFKLEMSDALGSYAEFFGIKTPGLHDAKIDCHTTLKVFSRMIKYIKLGGFSE